MIVQYREPVNNLLASVEIMSGCQAEVGHGWTREQKEKVIRHLEIFGARDAAETHRDMGKFLGLLYRDNGLVSADEIRMGHDAVVETQEQRSATEATRAVLGFDRAVNDKTRAKGRRVARTTEVEVEQLSTPDQRRTGAEVVFKMAVDPEGRTDVPLPA